MTSSAPLTKDALTIFLFHGVVEVSNYEVRNYTRKHIEKDVFASFIRKIKKTGYALSMDEVIRLNVERDPFPPYAFAVTFDDGFANNYEVAAPILSDEAVPATFYITTGFIEGNTMSWIDRIEFCLERKTKGKLRLPWSPEERVFKSKEEKIMILDEIRLNAKRNAAVNCEELVERVFSCCGENEISSSSEPIDRKMTWEEVRALHDSSDFLIGGHSHTHKILSHLNPEELESEIATSLMLLREMGVATRHYSYPEGLEHCYSDQVVERLKAHGIVCCPTAVEGVNRPGDSLFHLKRKMVD